MTGLGYTVPAAASVAVVCGAELVVLRTGLFRRPAYWVAIAIVLALPILNALDRSNPHEVLSLAEVEFRSLST